MAADRTYCWLLSQLEASRSENVFELDTGSLEVTTDTGQTAAGAQWGSDI